MTTETTKQVKPLFELGRIIATAGALSTMQERNITPETLLIRHICCDWQDMEDEDQESNREALSQGMQIISTYVIDEVTFFVITEGDRSRTTILLPEEY